MKHRFSTKILSVVCALVTVLTLIPALGTNADAAGATIRGNVFMQGERTAVTGTDITIGAPRDSKRLEFVQLSLNGVGGDIIYQTHVIDKGWTAETKNGEWSGRFGSKVQAIKIRLSGEAARKYTVIYRAYVESQGWLGWTSEGCMAGTTGTCLQMKALQIRLLDISQKNDFVLGKTYYIASSLGNGNYVLDVQNGNKNANANVWLYPRNNTAAQKWVIEGGDNGRYLVRSVLANYYLEIADGQSAWGKNVQVGTLNPLKNYKTWYIGKDSSGYYRFDSCMNTGACLGVTAAPKQNNPTQKFTGYNVNVDWTGQQPGNLWKLIPA